MCAQSCLTLCDHMDHSQPGSSAHVTLQARILVQFHSVTHCDPMGCSTPGLPVHHQLPELTETHVHRVGDTIQPSHPAIPFSSCFQSFPPSGSFQLSQFFTSGGQSIGVSASALDLPMNIQD